MSYEPRLKKKYQDQIIADLRKEFSYKSVMQVPRIKKICLNQGIDSFTVTTILSPTEA